MNSWANGIQNAIQYIEENLTEDLQIEAIAAKAYVSPFHFQRIFSVLCGFTVGEYIRMRRLTLAAQDLSLSGSKIIDIAMKYGYDSHDSFTRAFTKFHGVSPKAAKEKGASLKSFAPLQIKLTLEGGTMTEYKIVEKASFTIMGKAGRFSSETQYQEIPKFWDEHYQTGGGEIICGNYGVCMDCGGKDFEYLIADNYMPCREIPEGCTTRVIPAGTWAVFSCKGALPKSIQELDKTIWSEWLPNCREYKLAGDYSVELYTPIPENPEDTYCEIWVPVKKI